MKEKRGEREREREVRREKWRRRRSDRVSSGEVVVVREMWS